MASLSLSQSIDLAVNDSDRSEARAAEVWERLSLDALVQEAQQESSRFRRQQPTSGRAAFEIFRRALLLRDDAAWIGLYQLYTPLIKAWLTRHPGVCVQAGELDGLVNETFAKFALALGARKWSRFACTSHLLAYLRCCALSVATDAWRQQQRWRQQAELEAIAYEQSARRQDPREDPAETLMRRQSSHDLWQVAASALKDESERLILEQHYRLGVALREFPARYPERFPTIQNVYRAKESLLHRLRRRRAVQEALGLDQTPAGRSSRRSTNKREASQKGTTR